MFKKLFIFCFSVILVSSFDSCQKVITFNVCFKVSTQQPTINQPVSFSNCSQGNQRNYWFFGDGTVDSVDVSPMHTYKVPGTYTVQLTIVDKYDDSMSITQTLFVNPVSSTYAGTFNGSEACTLSGSNNTSIIISNVGDTVISIFNLYKSDSTVLAHTNGLIADIVPLNFNTGSGNRLLSGTLQYSGATSTGAFDTITLNLIVTSFSSRDNCTAILVKQ